MEKMKRLTINDWNESDRPREKLLEKGKKSLTDAELIAILMGSGNTEETAVDLAKRILVDNKNNLIELSNKSVADLIKYKGIGEAKAISIIAALELGFRRRQADVIEKKLIISSKDSFEYMSLHLCDASYEQFWIILLNNVNRIITHKIISEGSITATVIDIKKIFNFIIESNASGIVLCHNHPSGNLKPSKYDIDLTKKIKGACKFFETRLIDHIIFGTNNYFSFLDEHIL